MSTSLARLQKNGTLNEWYEEIRQRKAQGKTVEEWCQEQHYSVATYYYRQKQVMQAIELRLSEAGVKEEVQFAALPEAAPDHRREPASIRLRLGELEVEIPSGASRENIHAVIEALKC